MRVSLSRHRVLVTVPVSQAALERLDTFFDVDLRIEPGRDPTTMLQLLRDKAGAIVDADIAFDAALVAQLPSLKAVSLIGPHPHRLDLDAFTEAGIRATRAPETTPVGYDEIVDPGVDRIAVEGLIASLGFGRRSFHPPYLLNPDVSCISCC